MSERTRTDRTRRALSSAAIAAAVGGFALRPEQAVASQDAAPNGGNPSGGGPDSDGQVVCRSFTLTDRRGRQRFLMSDRKPPIIIDGEVLPPEKRGGPDHATYLILNDGQGNEKGGIVGHDAGASVSLDYPTSQGATLYTRSRPHEGAAEGVAVLSLAAMAPAVGERAAERVVLSGGNSGAALQLNDSKGRPRILIGLDADDQPMIKILDADGEPVTDLLA